MTDERAGGPAPLDGDLAERIALLSADSVGAYRDAESEVDWRLEPAPHAWLFAPEASPLHGTAYWDELDDAERHRLAALELARLLHGSIAVTHSVVRALMDAVLRDRKRPSLPEPIRDHLLHACKEDLAQVLLLERALRELELPAIAPPPALLVPPGGALGWLPTALVSLVAKWGRLELERGATAGPAVHPLVRRVVALHHGVTSRHLDFLRLVVRALWRSRPETERARVLPALASTTQQVVAETQCAPRVLRALAAATPALAEPEDVAGLLARHATSLERRVRVLAPILSFLRDLGIAPGPSGAGEADRLGPDANVEGASS